MKTSSQRYIKIISFLIPASSIEHLIAVLIVLIFDAGKSNFSGKSRTLKTCIHERLFNAMYKTLQQQSGEIKWLMIDILSIKTDL